MFLAATPPEGVEEKLRDELAELLRAQGCEVVPEANPLDPDEVHKCAPEWVSKCDKFVQILGPRYGKWKHDDTGFVLYQHDLARKSNKQIFVYRGPSLDISHVEHPGYHKLLESLEQDDTGDLEIFVQRVFRFGRIDAE